MANYKLDLLNMLVVEDSSFIRSLLMSSLGALGIFRAKVACDGADAINLLRLMKSDPSKAGLMHLDLILSDWEMAPVDGALLLKWVLRSNESPNRYMPFIVMTAHSEPEVVKAARDLGATHVLAKPFSVETLSRAIVDVVEHPRMFVHTKDYFGPCRRRHAHKDLGDGERRKFGHQSAGAEVIHE